MQYTAFTLLVSLTIFGGVQAQTFKCDKPLQLNQGLIQGEVLVSTSGGKFCSFRAIPYAKAPVGERRFQPPEAAEPWNGTLNATNDGPVCPQVNFLTGKASYNEDCLTLNVYSPLEVMFPLSLGLRKRPLPVLVFIHGGGFVFGDAGLQTYPPHRILEERVLLVVLQYRLGIFGFLSTGSADAPGNYGLLDQRLALQWVQANIGKFGGDPKKVVIFGESAGSASVVYQLISRGSKGLFNGVIAQSGSVLNHWALQKDPYPYALQLGQALHCNSGNDRSALVACLKNNSVHNIIGVMVALKWFDSILGPFVPVVEDPAYGKFITEDPQELLEYGDIKDVPVIMGTNKHELALIFLGLPIAQVFNTIDDNFFDVLLPGLIAKMTKRKTNLLEISYAVKREYFDKIDVTNRAEVVRTAIQFLSDLGFNAGSSLTERILAKRRFSVYRYSLEHAGNVSQTTFSGEKDIKHGDDLYYLFNLKPLTVKDQAFSRTLVKMWANLPKYRNPTPFWFIAEGWSWGTTGRLHRLSYLEMGEDAFKMKLQSHESLAKDAFWNEIAPYSTDPAV